MFSRGGEKKRIPQEITRKCILITYYLEDFKAKK